MHKTALARLKAAAAGGAVRATRRALSDGCRAVAAVEQTHTACLIIQRKVKPGFPKQLLLCTYVKTTQSLDHNFLYIVWVCV